jgi:Pentapeptide repeats (8 copies)
MSENLLTQSVVKLFGRVLQDLYFKYDLSTVVRGYDNFLQRQLSKTPPPSSGTTVSFYGTVNSKSYTITAVGSFVGLLPGMSLSAKDDKGSPYFSANTVIAILGSPGSAELSVNILPLMDGSQINITATPDGMDVKLARIYGFAFEGAYYGLPRPSIFLVHGNGIPVGNWDKYPSTLDQAGVAGREWDFSGNQILSDIYCWEYEKGDFSIRFDTEAGPFEQILLVAMLRAGADMADRATPRSGASLSGASLSGASLSGASLSGASLSGASLSGASLSGASLRGR